MDKPPPVSSAHSFAGTPSSPIKNDETIGLGSMIETTKHTLKNMEQELTDLRKQASGLPERISAINATLARMEASDSFQDKEGYTKPQLKQTLATISQRYQDIAHKERILEGTIIKLSSELENIENKLKLKQVKAKFLSTQHHKS